MKARRLFVVSFALAGIACAAAAACTFPSVEFKPGAPSEGGEGGSSLLDGSNDGSALRDGGDPASIIGGDAGEKVDAAGCTTCDCDGDGFFDLSKSGCAGSLGPNDCDDTDTTTRPDQKPTTKVPYPPRNGDWNCTNGVEKFYRSLVKCTGPGGDACGETRGFQDDPACGSMGTYVQCVTKGATLPPLPVFPGTCEVGPPELRTQACQ